MCFSLAAFNPLVGAAVPVRILDPRCVGKTFPDYFEALFAVAEARPDDVPVITIDGPTASGKGTLASAVAQVLGYHFLDSGALYRATALAALRADVPETDEAGLAACAAGLKLRFHAHTIWLGHQDGSEEDISDQLREEYVGAMASKVSVWPAVREALLQLQYAHRRLPGLVADGRDMGTVIFPRADLKVFVTASAAVRAERRHKQLISKGNPSNIDDLRAELEARDARDQSRSVSPLKPAQDAKPLDNSTLSVDTCVALVLAWWQQRKPFGQQ
jgi:3-phosphoshikimate 1-carboxyvinyltransferase